MDYLTIAWLNPNFPLTYQFTDLDYGKKFVNEVRIGKLASFFSPHWRYSFPASGLLAFPLL
jgi:hypothetical protein